MPTALPEHAPRALNRWHIFGIGGLVGFLVATAAFWLMPERSGEPTRSDLSGITTGIAPADQSGKPLPR